MPQYLSPGVYVEEVDSGSRPIEGVGTAVAAFVGLATQGPFNTPTLVSNWTQFSSTFGDFAPGTYLAHAVFGYFMNGGGNCYVVRIGDDGKGSSSNGRAAIEAAPQAALGNRLRAVAIDGNLRPGEIEVEVAPAGGEAPTDDMFKLVVKRGGQVVEEFDRADDQPRQAERRDDRQRRVQDHQDRGRRHRRAREAGRGHGRADAARTAGRGAVLVADRRRLRRRRRRAHRVRRARGHRRGHDGRRPRPDERLPARAPSTWRPCRPSSSAMIAHCELMGDRVAILDPPPGLNAQQIKEWRVDKARLRLQVRHALLAVDQGVRPGHRARRSTSRRAGTSPASGAATTTPAACTRRRPTR